jgi:hypothetical protein
MKHIILFTRMFEKGADVMRGFAARLNLTFAGKCIVVAFVFICSFVYLNQKVNIYVSAYQLNDNYASYQELTAKRDYLLYAFDKQVSLPKINQWVSKNNFSFAGKDKMIALNLRPKEKRSDRGSKLASVFNRMSGMGTAMAHNGE